MITKQIGGSEVVLYEDIDEIPEVRREKFDTYSILGSELNPRLDSFNDKFNTIITFIRSDKKPEAEEALINLQKSIMLSASGNNLNRIAYGALVKSIDGVLNDDLSDESLDSKIQAIKELTTTEINETLDSQKKSLLDNYR